MPDPTESNDVHLGGDLAHDAPSMPQDDTATTMTLVSYDTRSMISIAAYSETNALDYADDDVAKSMVTPPSHLRRIINNYMLDTEDEWSDFEDVPESEALSTIQHPLVEDNAQSTADVVVDRPSPTNDTGTAHAAGIIITLQPSLLPQVINVASTNVSAVGESFFDRFTYYKELREAQTDSDYEHALTRLLREWWAVGASVSVLTLCHDATRLTLDNSPSL